MTKSLFQSCALALLLLGGGSLWAANEPACGLDIHEKGFPQKLLKQFKKDLVVLSSIQGGKASDLHAFFFGSEQVDGASYCAFLRGRISEIHYAKSGEVAAVNAEGVVTLSEYYFSIDQAYRLGILIHESMHTEVGGDRKVELHHHNCPDPYLGDDGKRVLGPTSGRDMSGAYGCDSTINSPNGAAYIWTMNVSLSCENCTKTFKENAQKASQGFAVYIDDPKVRQDLRKDLGLD